MFEMGMTADLEFLFSFTYKHEFDNGLIEHEFDHVFVGFTNDAPNPNTDEVSAYQWISMEECKRQMELSPEIFTPWFHLAFDTFVESINKEQL